MKTFKQFIVEAKQVGTLYHYTSPENAIKIIHSNEMNVRHARGSNDISFTRNKNFHKDGYDHNRAEVPTHVSFEINGDKLSDRHKIRPFHDEKHHRYLDTRDEAEERVNYHIPKIRSYINKVRIHDHTHPDSRRVEYFAEKHGIPIEHVK